MNRIPIRCLMCGVELENGLDTFGDLGQEICATCWYYDVSEPETIYGLAPHYHDLNITGCIFGSTVLEPLPSDPPHPVYGYWIEDRHAYFRPDDDVEGAMGIWTYIGKQP